MKSTCKRRWQQGWDNKCLVANNNATAALHAATQVKTRCGYAPARSFCQMVHPLQYACRCVLAKNTTLTAIEYQ